MFEERSLSPDQSQIHSRKVRGLVEILRERMSNGEFNFQWEEGNNHRCWVMISDADLTQDELIRNIQEVAREEYGLVLTIRSQENQRVEWVISPPTP